MELLTLFFSFLVKHGGMLSVMNGFLDLSRMGPGSLHFIVGMSIEISSDLIENLPLVLVASGVYSVD